ncbi:ATP-binding cassette domain-containing protein [Micromonospora sp. DR5-3]|uniref:ABC transporter ATP-binding protein n=1 Tax=unclassified Micromonospora TaxID=2617518 RepID=UPI0011D586B7|nr:MULTISPECIES: ATP-binding cassette domain-containing protein [unclassified Micromonospora]MCW3813230.1 ATP-binding cassette domain-containing protein [Micromonospora sp. DR5-3]TYC24625.1 ATP-binding cassette domain-containing protein [Micromonospora sp. MP36]
MITLRGLTKRFGTATAVDDLTVDIGPGQVTGFLGPNGAGKSTTMRMVLGLDRPTAGRALVNGRPYRELRHPLHEVGALLDATGIHPTRSGRSHLRAMARSNGIPARRVAEVLDLVGLDGRAADKPGRALSLGMGQRLGIAGALLGDPPVLLLDEPVNGLDPDGVRWIRRLTRTLADEGRTVLLSSHLMSEMQQTADRVVVLGRGRLIADAPLAELIAASPAASVRVRGPEPAGLAALGARLTAEGATVTAYDADGLTVTGTTASRVGDLAYELGVRVHELTPLAASLEEAFLELTADSVEYAAGPAGGETR